jgi:DNA-binding FadR family transcriptional regulator
VNGDIAIPDPDIDAEGRKLFAFSPIVLRKAADEVVAVLVDAIHGGVFQPGDRLPRERDLAARLEVSRATVREAIARLVHAGLVSVKRGNNGGIVVIKRLGDPILLGEATRGPTEMRALLEARRPLEMAAALLACENATAEDIAELEQLVDDLATLVAGGEDADDAWTVDVQFHVRLAEASHNQVLAELVADVFRRYRMLRTQYPVGRIALEPAVENHLVRTSAVMEEHLGSLEEHFFGVRLGPAVHPHVNSA